jgi:hypothetical protein
VLLKKFNELAIQAQLPIPRFSKTSPSLLAETEQLFEQSEGLVRIEFTTEG